MLKKKRKTDRPLLVTAMIVLVMVASVMVACQNDYYLYQRHFKIEEIHMTRVSIDSFPADPAVMYLIESALSDCPPETIKTDGKARGYPPYAGGSIDTILSVEFTHNGTPVIPTQLHWHNCYDIMIASKGIRREKYRQKSILRIQGFKEFKLQKKQKTTILKSLNP